MSDDTVIHEDRPRIGYVALRTNTHGEVQWSISVPLGATQDDMNDTIEVALCCVERLDGIFGRPIPKDSRPRRRVAS